ncbi:MAG: pantoate--beta-alanine ligase [Planctomycetes bacterium]|nr:pantoate--beta-alanine ligase [Planctomycetota bacterium]
MLITHTIDETRDAVGTLGEVALVPTMGALHAGHMALVKRAKMLSKQVVVSIFVNPTQFGPHEDLARYPRPIERDLAMCRTAGVDLAFCPTVDVMYPADELEVTVDVPAMSAVLEGVARPGHFVGVCRVVAKLFSIVQPRTAVFGMKDYQQLKVIEAMTAGLCLPVRIEAAPTVREADGLALSSRNVYLTSEQRPAALSLSKALAEAETMIRDGVLDPASIESAMRMQMQAHHVAVDYAAVRSARTLAVLDVVNVELAPVVCLVAGRVGTTRLIDNRVVAGSR